MKRAFAAFFILFVAMYAAALATLDPPPDPNFVHLRWATDSNPARVAQCALFHKMYPHDEAAVDSSESGDLSQVLVQCATGEGPDVIDIYSQQDMETLVSAGILLNLTPYAKAMGFGVDQTYPAIRDALMVAGKEYRFPDNVGANCVIYDRKVFDELGVPYPKLNWSYSDFVKTAQMIHDRAAAKGETILPITDNGDLQFYQDLLVGYGGQMFMRHGLVSAFDTAPDLASMRFYQDLIYKYKAMPDPSESASLSSQGGWGSAGIDWFSSGKAAMIAIGRWYIVQLGNWPGVASHLGVALLPRVGNRASCGVTNSRAAGINIKSHHIGAALNFLRYLASSQYSRLIVEDGDSLPPSPALANTGQDIVNHDEPNPAFHEPFIIAEKKAVVLDTSEFIESSEVNRWLLVTTQQVASRALPPDVAMRDLAAQIDEGIREDLESRPDLQRLFEKHTGRPYTPDWWRTFPGFISE